jgi:hypothetical protein
MAKPLRPEPKFFLDYDEYARGADHYDARFFSDSNARVHGEKSTSYIEDDVAVRRITALFPDVEIVVVVRDPVARAVSNYRFSTTEGVETLPLADALRAEDAGDREWDRKRFSVSPFAYLARGRYAEALSRVQLRVPPGQLHVIVFEELVTDESVLAALYERLGVDARFRPAGIGMPVNVSRGADGLDESTENWIRAYYSEPNRRLEELLGRPLPWAQSAGVR